MGYKPVENEIFHIHTKRCKHASDEEDYKYVEAAIGLGANRIVFTDHVPFPGDPFLNRMDYSELDEYISSMKALKQKYFNNIEVLCGLEIEFLPDYIDYYKKLKSSGNFDLLIIGQHFFQHAPGVYSISDKDKTFEFEGQCEAMAQGIQTGLFDVIAHPDRSFRASLTLGEREQAAAMKIIDAAEKCQINRPYFEQNMSSKLLNGFYKEEFWNMLPEYFGIITGLDAHSTQDLIYRWINRYKF